MSPRDMKYKNKYEHRYIRFIPYQPSYIQHDTRDFKHHQIKIDNNGKILCINSNRWLHKLKKRKSYISRTSDSSRTSTSCGLHRSSESTVSSYTSQYSSTSRTSYRSCFSYKSKFSCNVAHCISKTKYYYGVKNYNKHKKYCPRYRRFCNHFYKLKENKQFSRKYKVVNIPKSKKLKCKSRKIYKTAADERDDGYEADMEDGFDDEYHSQEYYLSQLEKEVKKYKKIKEELQQIKEEMRKYEDEN